MRLFRRSPGALISSIKTGFIFEINVELGMVWESSYPGTRTDNIIRPGKEAGHERHIGIEEVVQSGWDSCRSEREACGQIETGGRCRVSKAFSWSW